MKRTFRLLPLSMACAVGLVSPWANAQDKKTLTFGEIQTIRIMAGGVVGNALANTMERPHMAMIANRSAVCSSLAGGIGGALTQNKADSLFTFESAKDVADTALAVDRTVAADGIYLAFGGEWKKEDNMAMLESTLEKLADKGYKGSVIFHVTSWAQKQPQEIAVRNPKVAAYFKSAQLRALTLNLDAKEATINKVTFDGSQFALAPAAKAPLRDDLVALFRRQ